MSIISLQTKTNSLLLPCPQTVRSVYNNKSRALINFNVPNLSTSKLCALKCDNQKGRQCGAKLHWMLYFPKWMPLTFKWNPFIFK